MSQKDNFAAGRKPTWQRAVMTIRGRSKLHCTCPVRERVLFSLEKEKLCGDLTALFL